MSEQITTQDSRPATLKSYISNEAVNKKFREVLGDRAPQFLSALVQIASDPFLAQCSPQSIAASAMTAATLDFPIQKSLGFAWIVPYRQKNGQYEASFQAGWRGIVQLALRSGQFKRLNAVLVNKDAYKGRDEMGEPIIDWDVLDESQDPVGYAVAWKLINGFTKVCYWTKERVIKHAQKYSKAYTGGGHSPWKDKDQFSAMALKTVVMNELKKWAPLSVQMQNAILSDNTFRKDIDSEPETIDIDSNGDRVEMAEGAPPVIDTFHQDERVVETKQPDDIALEFKLALESGAITLQQAVKALGIRKQIVSVYDIPIEKIEGAMRDWATFKEAALNQK